jgi:hypothetical protein
MKKFLSNMDKVYGCDNPHRQLTDIEYKVVSINKELLESLLTFDNLSTNFQDLLNFEGSGGGSGYYCRQ